MSDGHYGRNDRCSPVCCYHTDVCVGRVFLIHVTINILKNRRNENEDENGKNAAESNGTQKVFYHKSRGIDGILVTVGLCIIALLLCVVMKDSLTSFIQAIVTAMQNKAIGILG